jgi:hypothetical protein
MILGLRQAMVESVGGLYNLGMFSISPRVFLMVMCLGASVMASGCLSCTEEHQTTPAVTVQPAPATVVVPAPPPGSSTTVTSP